MPLEVMDRKTYLEAKFGSLDAFERLEDQVLAAGAAERIPFAFDQIQRTPNTFAAHRLIWYARLQGTQNTMMEALFLSYFVEGQDIGNLETLARTAAQAGLDPAMVEAFLKSDDGAVEVGAEEAAGHRLGIRGVPYFVVNGTSAISGAQTSDRFVSALKRAAADGAERKAGP